LKKEEFAMRYFKKIEGERIYLSPINKEDVETYTNWLNDIKVAQPLGNYSMQMTIDVEKKWLDENSSVGHNYAIILKDGDKLLGNIGSFDIDPISRACTIGLFVGDIEYRGKGYGTEAIKIYLEYCFKTLNLHNIMLAVYAFNEIGVACYKKVGFKEIGRRREAKYSDGQYVDIVYMDILSMDFLKKNND
jgi:RimJ/RimL family protein N-acetyltransferase